VAAQPLQQALAHLDTAFTRFFRENRGCPQFKTKRGPQSAVYPHGVRMAWGHSLLYVPKAGWVGAVFSRWFTGRIKTVTVRRVPSGQFFMFVLVEDESQILDSVPETADRAVGVDLNLHEFAVLPTGDKIPRPQRFEPQLRRLKILQRRFAKKAQGSRNREKMRRQIARLHERIANRRQDFLHKLSTDLFATFWYRMP
jgi:putative transposase